MGRGRNAILHQPGAPGHPTMLGWAFWVQQRMIQAEVVFGRCVLSPWGTWVSGLPAAVSIAAAADRVFTAVPTARRSCRLRVEGKCRPAVKGGRHLPARGVEPCSLQSVGEMELLHLHPGS